MSERHHELARSRLSTSFCPRLSWVTHVRPPGTGRAPIVRTVAPAGVRPPGIGRAPIACTNTPPAGRPPHIGRALLRAMLRAYGRCPYPACVDIPKGLTERRGNRINLGSVSPG